MSLRILALAVLLLPALTAPAAGVISDIIKLDHFGYRPGDAKIIVFTQDPGSPVELRDSATGAIVFTVTSITSNGQDPESGDDTWTADASIFATPGVYYVYVPSLDVRSYDFEIADNIYNRPCMAAAKAYYYQRCNAAKSAPHAGPWQDAVCHSTDLSAVNHKGGGIAGHGSVPAQPDYGVRDHRGGWHDAGDYQKTVGWFRGVEPLLWAYELRPGVFSDNALNIPESGNGIPDLLDQVRYELDFYMRMQMPDGHFLTSQAGTGGSIAGPPSQSNETRGYTDEWPDASTGFGTLALAHASILYRSLGQAAAADSFAAAARNGWSWLSGRSLTGGNNEIKCGAAAAVYRMDTTIAAAGSFVEIYPDWWGVGPANYNQLNWAVWHYHSNPRALPAVKSAMAQAIVANVVNTVFGVQDVYSGLRGSTANTWDYHWGSNQNQGAYGQNLMLARQFGMTGSRTSAELHDQAQNYLHYLHGRNPLSMVYLTNMAGHGGEHSSFQTYHSWFSYTGGDGENGNADFNGLPAGVNEPLYPYFSADNQVSQYGPAPGIMVGGPNHQYSGTWNPPQLSVKYPTKMYRDFSVSCDWSGSMCRAASWEITETSLGYMGPYLFLCALFAGEDQATGSVRPVPEVSHRLYPNPAAGQITIHIGRHSAGGATVTIMNALGREVVSREVPAGAESREITVSVAHLPSGVYWLTVTSAAGRTAARFVLAD